MFWSGIIAIMEVLEKKPTEYDREIAIMIGNLVREGIPINKICSQGHMPSYTTLAKWRRSHPEMASILMQARIDRADFFHGLAAETLVNLHNDPEPTMNEIGRARTVMEYGLKLAEVDDPRTFGKNQEDTNPHQTVVIITGVPLSESNKVINYDETLFGRKRELDDSANRVGVRGTAGTAEVSPEPPDYNPGLPDL